MSPYSRHIPQQEHLSSLLFAGNVHRRTDAQPASLEAGDARNGPAGDYAAAGYPEEAFSVQPLGDLVECSVHNEAVAIVGDQEIAFVFREETRNLGCLYWHYLIIETHDEAVLGTGPFFVFPGFHHVPLTIPQSASLIPPLLIKQYTGICHWSLSPIKLWSITPT